MDSRSELRSPLSQRTEPSGSGQPTDSFQSDSSRQRRSYALSQTAGRNAELLLPGRCLITRYGDDQPMRSAGPASTAIFGVATPSRSNECGTDAGRLETGAYDLPLAGVGNRTGGPPAFGQGLQRNLRGPAEWLVSCTLRLARRAKPESVSPLVRLQFPFDGRRSL